MPEYTSHADIPRGVSEMFYAELSHSTNRWRGDVDAALARARDTALHGLKTIEAITASELLVSNDPMTLMLGKLANLFPGVGQQPGKPE